MRLLSLHLSQFRSFPSLSLDFSGGDVHLLTGPNGSGKTNVLEAMSVLSLTKSFLGVDEDLLMQWGTEFYRVRGECETMDRDSSGNTVTKLSERKTIEIVSQISPRRQKAGFINDVRTPVADLVGTLPAVMFLPQDLALFSGPPAERRRFLDQLLCQVSPQYLRDLSQYQKLLKQRNALLKSIAQGRADREDLKVWDIELALAGSSLTLARLELVETFGVTLTSEVQSLGEKWGDVRLCFERTGEARGLEELQKEMVTLLAFHRDRDILLQSTTVGPHREDWRVEADGRDITGFASRGQQRVCVLSLLFLEASYLELKRGEKPIILLDDIFSELDGDHQQAVLRTFGSSQVFMTSTHVPEGLERGAMVWEVERGQIGSPLPAEEG